MSKAEQRILLIEDDAAFRHPLAAFLEQGGANVYQAEDGIEGLSAAALYCPDVVLCDLNMPNLDGHEVIACLAARHPKVPVIVISGQDQIATIKRALQAGARDYFIKPVRDYEQVRRSIDQCLIAEAPANPQLELMAHIDFFRGHDKAASRLLNWLRPPSLQAWGPWQVTFSGKGNLFIPDSFKLDDKLLVLVMELPILGVDAAFCRVLVRSLMNGPLRQYQQQASLLPTQPHRLLDYLNQQLIESGLRHSFAMAALLFDREDGLLFANAGLSSPHWLMRAGGLPLGLMRAPRYTLHKRSWHDPFEVQFHGDCGGALHMQVSRG